MYLAKARLLKKIIGGDLGSSKIRMRWAIPFSSSLISGTVWMFCSMRPMKVSKIGRLAEDPWGYFFGTAMPRAESIPSSLSSSGMSRTTNSFPSMLTLRSRSFVSSELKKAKSAGIAAFAMQLTRLELYQQVCDRPLSKVAPDHGISGTALAAICKQYRVPYPGSGYWTRKSLGLQAELPTLPEASDDTIEITPSVPKPRQKRALEEGPARKTTAVPKPHRPARHSLLFGVEEHLRKTRDVKSGEFLRPYKRILPDLISSEPALLRALSITNDIYLALDKRGYRVHIAQPTDDLHRIHIKEQEVERKDRKYGRYPIRQYLGTGLLGYAGQQRVAAARSNPLRYVIRGSLY